MSETSRISLSRRDFLHTGLVAGAGAVLVGPSIHSGMDLTTDLPQGLCVTLCNHWSYVGIGWQMGIESCVLSVTDAMGMADRPPHVKTCINLDARAYEFMAEKFPEVTERLRKYLSEGKVELIGGTYGQPMGTMFSGESNIRQVVVGRETIRNALGYEMVTFLEEEEFTHPQVPQIAAGASFRYASLAQVDTWGRAGCPVQEFNVISWKGVDGTTIPSIPKNPMFGFRSNYVELAAMPVFKKLQGLGKPLLFTWEEFGWESPEHPAYLTCPAKYQEIADKSPVEFVTCKDYLDKYGSNPKEVVFLPMDAWDKSLTWGLGGDQLRIMDRKVEGLLLAAERLDAVNSTCGAPSHVEDLEKAWKNLMASQSHDVGLCEYSRWQGDQMAVMDRIEDYHNFTWGAIGYEHLGAAEKQGQTVLDASLGRLAARINSMEAKRGSMAVTVFNSSAWQRSDLVLTGRIFPIAEKGVAVLVKDRTGRILPSQIVKADRDSQGNLVMANVAFAAKKVPSIGYDTYYLELTPKTAAPQSSDLRIDEKDLILENEFVKVRLDPLTGAVASLIHKATGRETLDGSKGAFPHFTGKPNPNLSLKPNAPANYDSAKSDTPRESVIPWAGLGTPAKNSISKGNAQLDWLEKGPVRATLRAQHCWRYLTFETRVSLVAGRPFVEVASRVFAEVPPHSDAWPPANIKEGYWMSFAPAFEVARVLRDYPFAVDATDKASFHALTFVDLVGKDRGLLMLHPGTQWFTRHENGVFSNLVMREWESHFSHEYGWPIYAEYRHALMPHATEMNNAERLQLLSEFYQPLLARVSSPQTGDLPIAKGFVGVAPAGVQLSAFRKKPGKGLEIRVVEVEGRQAPASVELGFPVAGACETNLLGAKVADVAQAKNELHFATDPWKIRTFEVESK